jgi:small-conductance mechanosensitive channel
MASTDHGAGWQRARRRNVLAALGAVTLVLAGFGGALAQPPPTAPNLQPSPPAAQPPPDTLADIQNRIATTTDDARLAAMEQQAAGIEADAQRAATATEVRLAQIAAALRPLTATRHRLTADQRATAAGLQAQQPPLAAQLSAQQALAAEAERAVDDVAERRRAGFSGRVLERSASPLTPPFWTAMANSISGDWARLRGIASDALAIAQRQSLLDVAWRLDLAVLGALLALIPARLWLLRFGRRQPPAKISALRRSLLALWTLAVDFGAPTLAASLVELGAEWAGVLSDDAKAIALAAVRSVAWVAAILALGRVLATDPDGRRRLLSLSDADARRVGLALWAVAIVTGAGAVIRAIMFIAGASLSATIAANCVLSLAYAAGAALILVSYRRGAKPVDPSADLAAAAARSPAWALISLALTLAIAATFGAVFAGYTTLAALISGQLFWLSLIGGLTYLLLRLIDDLFMALFRQGGRTAAVLADAFGLRRRVVLQAGLLLSAGLQVVILVIALTLALTPFGQSGELLAANVRALSGAFKIGNVAVSPTAIAAGLAAFGVCMAAVHVARGWIVRRYLPVTGWDAGIRNSVAVGVGYVGVFIAIAIGLAVTGLGFQQIALVASALSVGIGFGLQQVVQNFVCGVILLIERPVKVGDWVSVGGVEGDVRRIRVRATEIETLDKAMVLVPNSNLITGNVENRTIGRAARIQVKLGLAKAADVKKASAAFVDVAAQIDQVLDTPSPTVFASALAAGGGVSLDGYVYVADPRHAQAVRSHLILALLDRFEQEQVALA